MKSFRIFALLSSAIVFGFTGCEQHSFDETKGLHQEHGHHGDEAGHGKGHAGVGAHADAAHGAKASDHAEKPAEAKPTTGEPRKTGL